MTIKLSKIIFPFIISFSIVFAIVGWLESPLGITFGHSRGADGVTLENESNVFYPGQPLHYRFLRMGDGELLQLVIERTDVPKQFIYLTKTIELPVDDGKKRVYATIEAPQEGGSYVMKITNLQENWLIAEGEFIVSSN